ncbi:MAG TPA: family 2A encapsulin nanocompartment cargo protein cysteine desulfurase [Polyangiaceae bacterium]|nr:family 2A encapsulin nanocompartment cargo protein cysteine desulfurase [Polyangiaceae bacterium]
MSTSGYDSGVSAPPSATDSGAGEALTHEIARLANQFFGQALPPPANPADPTSPVAAAPVGSAPIISAAPRVNAVHPTSLVGTAQPSPVSPPSRIAPSAFSTGAGGLSTAATLPPTPGALIAPPLASAPPPRESDLRGGLNSALDAIGIPNLALFDSSPSSDTPYYLQHAGVPGAVPAAVSSGVAPHAGLASTNGAPPVSAPLAAGWAAPAAPALATPTAPVGAAPALPGLAAPTITPLPSTASASPQSGTSPLGVGSTAPASPLSSGFTFQPEVVPLAQRHGGILDPVSVKRDFPILNEHVHGRPIIWLDNAATTQKPKSVIDRLTHFYEHENSNIHRAAHTLAARATDAYESGRNKVARFLNAPSVAEIVFVRGATEGINLVAQSWGRRNIGPGDEIVITWLEHHANIVPWQQLAAEKGAVLRVAPVDDRGDIILEEYERLFNSRTRLASITHVSNALGTIVPVKTMTEIAHRHGACVLVDGAQAVSHQRVDVQDIGCEFYVFSGHKVFAPTGIGALFGKRAVLEAMPPWQGGGNMISDVRFERTSYQPPPARFEAGTGNIADAAGLGAAIDYVEQLGLERIAHYEHELLEYGHSRLLEVPGLRLIGTSATKAGVLSFVIDGIKTEELGAALDRYGIAVRAGHHCAQPILRRYGLESTVRASLAPYNTRDDLDALVAALRRLTGR